MSTEIVKKMITQGDAEGQDFPLGEVPEHARKGMYSMATVLLGFTFFTSTMWAGGKLGVSYKFWPDLVGVMLIGNFLLGIYVAILGYIAYKTGYNSVVLSRYSFGDWGSKWPDFVFGITQIGWYAWGTATIAMVFVKMLGLSESLLIPFMIFFGFAFCWTAYIGYRGLEALSVVAVPAMTILIIWSFIISVRDVGGLEGLVKIVPKEHLTFAQALTIVFGTFVSGGTQSTNWSRFSKSAKIAIISSLAAFFVGNGLMIFAGAFGGYVYQQPDIVEVLLLQGLWLPALVMLFLNVWTTQDNTIYNFSVAGCNMFRTENRRLFNLGGAAIGTMLAIAGMYNWLVPYIILLGTFIPPIGGVIMADFFIKNKRQYPKLSQVKFKKFNYVGISAYIIGALVAKFSPGVPPINGIVASVIAYTVLDKIAVTLNLSQYHEIEREASV
ncbi:cytosine permease [Zhaonella formicivorans]|uniref:cytosine permease n=1 Tax=Zhaonella formicivorans TaxID=2528593 RepID=UPI001D12249F|nr:cytosine permease [Zhaonella formicivorans]